MLSLNQSGVTSKVKGTNQMVKASEGQEMNNAGGFSFKLSPEKQLDRFLILGCDSSTYYANKNDLNLKNLNNIIHLLKNEDTGIYAVERATEFSLKGKTLNNDTSLAVLALASAHGCPKVKQLAHENLNKVARIGTHILHFAKFINDVRGWGHSIKKAVSAWYTSKSNDQLAFQYLKYKSRDGWSHRDVMRLAHPKAVNEEANNLYKYIVTDKIHGNVPQIVYDYEIVKKTGIEAISKLPSMNLTREMLPTELLSEVKVWQYLIENMPITAIIRNLNKMTYLGLFNLKNKKGESYLDLVVNRITDKEVLSAGRVHPIKILFAYYTYKAGKGDKGKLVWIPNPNIVNALEQAFYLCFDNVPATGKKMLLAFDISGSMSSSMIANSNLSAKDASMALGMVAVKTEKPEDVKCIVFDYVKKSACNKPYHTVESGIKEIKINPETTLDQVRNIGGRWEGGATDCSLPMVYALEKKLFIDVFIVYTDSETWHGNIHPHEALLKYRKAMNNNAKLIVIGMTSNGFSIADPKDSGSMDIVGFDPDTPAIIDAFINNFN